MSDSNSGPPTVSFATTRIRCSSGGPAAGTCLTGASTSPRPNSHQSASAVSAMKTANPSHLLITEPITISAK